MVFSLIYLAVLLGVVHGTPWKCETQTIPIDTTGGKIFYYPDDVILKTQEFYSPQSCRWSLIVPTGKYAFISTRMNLNLEDSLSISSGPMGNYNHDTANGDIPRSGNPKFYIPSGNYTISLISKSSLLNGSFAFSANLNKLPNTISQTISADTQKTLSLENMTGKQTLLTSSRAFTLRTIAGGCGYVGYYYDHCHLYKGNNAENGTFISGLYQYLGGVPPALSGDYTLVCHNDYIPIGSSLLITGVPDIPLGATWKVVSECTDISLVAPSTSPAYVTDYCKDDCTKYLTRADPNFLNGVSVDMYSGSIGDAYSYLETISHSNYINSLPQQINGGQFKTFRVQSGSITIMLTAFQGTWPVASPRSGFISSPNYGISSSNQNFQTSISSKTHYFFTYTIHSIDSGKLTVEIDQGGTTFTDSLTNTSQQVKNTVAGYGIKFNYDLGSSPSKGMLAHYEITEYNSSTTGGFLVILSAFLLMKLYFE